MQLYVISGSDDAAVKSRANALITEWLGPEFDTSADLEIIRGDDETVAVEDSLNEFLASAKTPPFFGDGKTVWLRHWNGFKVMSDSRSTKAGEALMNRFAEEVVKPEPIEGIRLLVDGSGLDGRKSLAKLLKNSENVEFELLNLPDQKAKDFVRQQVGSISQQAKAAGYKITPDAAEYLAAATGSDSALRSNELEKLYCYTADEKVITLDDCREVVTFDAAAVSWELGSALSERNTAGALALLTPILRTLKKEKSSGNQELSLLWSAAGAFTDIVQTKSYMQELNVPKHFGPNFFSQLDSSYKERFPKNKLLSYHPYRAYKLCESAARWSPQSLAKALDLITEAQRKMVSGSDALLTLENLVIDLGNC